MMDADLVPVLLPYLYNDRDRLNLLLTCKEFYRCIYAAEFTDVHKYIKVKHLPYLGNFRNLKLKYNPYDNELNVLPKNVTILNYRCDIPIQDLPEAFIKQLREIKFRSYYSHPLADVLPKNVHTVRLYYTYQHPHPKCDVIVYGKPNRQPERRGGLRPEIHRPNGWWNAS